MIVAGMVLEYLRALAWPTVALVAIAIFRPELSALFGRVTEASAFGASIKLAKSAERAADASAGLPELAADDKTVGATPDESASTLGRMLLAWNDLESMIRAVSKALDLPTAGSHNFARTVRELHAQNVISEEALMLARDLQEIRNQLVHDTDSTTVTASTADDFIAATRRLTAAVGQALPRPTDAAGP